MEGSPEWKSGSLARGVVDAGVPKVGRLRPDRSTCGSGRGPGAAPTCATWSGCRGLVPNYAARSVSVVKLSPQPHSAATLGFSNTNCSFRPCLRKSMRVPSTSARRSEEHTSELQSLMRISYAVFCLKKKQTTQEELTD